MLESELFITQSCFSGGTAIELSENNLKTLFAVQTTSKQLTISNSAQRIPVNRPQSFRQIKKTDSGRGIITVSDKEIQVRNERRIP